MAAHAEYKVPGGKLVVVDVSVEAGTIAGLEVSGDFFLEPPEALEDIVGALIGKPASTSVEDMARAVTAGLRPGAELIGFSPEAVAEAVCRALERDTPRERA